MKLPLSGESNFLPGALGPLHVFKINFYKGKKSLAISFLLVEVEHSLDQVLMSQEPTPPRPAPGLSASLLAPLPTQLCSPAAPTPLPGLVCCGSSVEDIETENRTKQKKLYGSFYFLSLVFNFTNK